MNGLQNPHGCHQGGDHRRHDADPGERIHHEDAEYTCGGDQPNGRHERPRQNRSLVVPRRPRSWFGGPRGDRHADGVDDPDQPCQRYTRRGVQIRCLAEHTLGEDAEHVRAHDGHPHGLSPPADRRRDGQGAPDDEALTGCRNDAEHRLVRCVATRYLLEHGRHQGRQ